MVASFCFGGAQFLRMFPTQTFFLRTTQARKAQSRKVVYEYVSSTQTGVSACYGATVWCTVLVTRVSG